MKDGDSGRPRFPPVNAFSYDMWCLVTDHRTIQLTSSPTYTQKKPQLHSGPVTQQNKNTHLQDYLPLGCSFVPEWPRMACASWKLWM